MARSDADDDYLNHIADSDFYCAANGAGDDELDVLDDYAPSRRERTGNDQRPADELDVLDDYAPARSEYIGKHRPVDELDALDDYAALQSVPGDTNLHDVDVPSQGENEELSGPQFTVTNPTGTVSVSALMDGSIYQVELSANVARLTEAELEAEIIVIADLAQQHAKSAQHLFILDRMVEAGATDSEEVRDFLREGMRLPTPEEAVEAQAEVFFTRYHRTSD